MKTRESRALRAGITALLLATTLGCGTVSFKRGATPDQIASDEKACRAATVDEDAYLECMSERGYAVSQLPDNLEATSAGR